MDNLRLEHPGPFSAHTQASLFASSSLDFLSQRNKSPNTHQHAHLPSPWTSLWSDPQYPTPQHPPSHLRNGLQSPAPDHTPSPLPSWDISSDPILQLTHSTAVTTTEFANSRTALRGDDPVLQLKNVSTISPTDFSSCPSTTMDVLRGDNTHFMDALRADNARFPEPMEVFRSANSSGILVAPPHLMDSCSSSPLSVVSGPQTIPFARKLDATEGQNLGFASVSRDELQRSCGMGREGAGAVKMETIRQSLMDVKVSDGRRNQQAIVEEKRGFVKEELQEGGVTIASLKDGSIGLKLGKRTYYEDTGGDDGIKKAAHGSNTCNGTGKNNNSKVSSNNISNINNNSNSSSGNNGSGGGTGSTNKKHKASSHANAVPKCQAEDCKADLSTAKDYHRRHKVCEWHSKASKAKVNNLEQRFCQQCSRFHLLTAFDEGKRSCRRRLAGHNERRRKPPPEPMSFLSPGSFAYFADNRINGSLHDRPCFIQRRSTSLLPTSLDNAILACQLGLTGFPQQETVGNYHALELHHFMQGLPPGGGAGVGLLDGGRTVMMAGGNSLALSNPSGPSLTSPPPSSSPIGLVPHVSSEMAISGRALSLLSSSLGSPENPCTMSISLGMTPPSIDQLLLSETRALASSRQSAPSSTSCFSSGLGMAATLHGLGHAHNHALNSLTSSSSGCSTEIDQGEAPVMPNFEGRSMFMMHSENGFQSLQDGASSQHGRPMLDLMQIASTESHQHQQSEAEITFADLHGLSIFGRPTMM